MTWLVRLPSCNEPQDTRGCGKPEIPSRGSASRLSVVACRLACAAEHQRLHLRITRSPHCRLLKADDGKRECHRGPHPRGTLNGYLTIVRLDALHDGDHPETGSPTRTL